MRQVRNRSEPRVQPNKALPDLDLGSLKSSAHERTATWQILVELCKQRGMRPRDICEAAGITPGYFYKIKRGEFASGIEPIMTLHARLAGHEKIDLTLESMPTAGLSPEFYQDIRKIAKEAAKLLPEAQSKAGDELLNAWGIIRRLVFVAGLSLTPAVPRTAHASGQPASRVVAHVLGDAAVAKTAALRLAKDSESLIPREPEFFQSLKVWYYAGFHPERGRAIIEEAIELHSEDRVGMFFTGHSTEHAFRGHRVSDSLFLLEGTDQTGRWMGMLTRRVGKMLVGIRRHISNLEKEIHEPFLLTSERLTEARLARLGLRQSKVSIY